MNNHVIDHKQNTENPDFHPPRKRRWWKRFGLAILMPIALFLAGALLLSVFGGGVTEKVSDSIKAIWFPASVFRLALYALIAFVVVPFFVRQRLDQVKQEFEAVEIERHDTPSDEEGYQTELQQYQIYIGAKIKAYTNYLSNRHWILTGLIIFDGLFIQMPFFLRG